MKRFFIMAALGLGTVQAAQAEGPAHNFTPESLVAAVDAYDQGYLQLKAQGRFEDAARLDNAVKAESFTYCTSGKTTFQDAAGTVFDVVEKKEPECYPHVLEDPAITAKTMAKNDEGQMIDTALIGNATINADSTALVDVAFVSATLREKEGRLNRTQCVYTIALDGDDWKLTHQQCTYDTVVTARPAPFTL